MATKLVLVVTCVYLLCQFITWGTASPRFAREVSTAPPTQDASKTIDDALNSLKTGLEDLVKQIQGNELFQNFSSTMEQFGQTVQTQGKQLVEKIQASAH